MFNSNARFSGLLSFMASSAGFGGGRNNRSERRRKKSKPERPRLTPADYTLAPDHMARPHWLDHALDPQTPTSDGIRRVRLDGVNHINIGGRTELGRLLSHHSALAFTHPYYGPFNCMEGYWYYIKAQKKDDTLRNLVGMACKQYGRRLKLKLVPNFKELILEANWHRIDQNPRLRELLIQSTLPFDHYYLFGEGNIAIQPKGSEWVVEIFEELRKMFKEGRKPEPIDYPA